MLGSGKGEAAPFPARGRRVASFDNLGSDLRSARPFRLGVASLRREGEKGRGMKGETFSLRRAGLLLAELGPAKCVASLRQAGAVAGEPQSGLQGIGRSGGTTTGMRIALYAKRNGVNDMHVQPRQKGCRWKASQGEGSNRALCPSAQYVGCMAYHRILPSNNIENVRPLARLSVSSTSSLYPMSAQCVR